MAGRIKGGEGTLIGNAGEFYVAAELLKRGVIAALAPRNAPAVDILATKGTRTVRLRVKTKTAEYTVWQWAVKKDGKIFRDLGEEDDFTVLVNLTPETKDLAFFIVPTHQLNTWLVDGFKKYVDTPGKNGRPHDPSNPKRNLPYPMIAKDLDQYRDNWDAIWK